MSKGEYLEGLFNDIKDNIEFDSDIIAITSILNAMLDVNVSNSFSCYTYIISNYDLNSLVLDINLSPLFDDYLYNFFKIIGIEYFFKYMNKIDKRKKKFIYNSIFNIYSINNFLYKCMELIVKDENLHNKEIFVSTILEESKNFPVAVFDKTTFLKIFIIIHIENNIVPLDYLIKICDLADNLKDRAILKTLLINYMT